MPKSHFVVTKSEDGGASIHKMKEWLRLNPDFLPAGLDPTSDTSHTLRAGLRRNGWALKETMSQVLVIKPDEDGSVAYASAVMEAGPKEHENENEILDAEELTFGLERDLQQALRANISKLEEGLVIIDGGSEKTTEAGRIDITAKDSKGTIVVIELKAGNASPDIIAQVLSYMGAVADDATMQVRGILVAGEFHKRVILAARALPNLTLKRYSFQFTFSDVDKGYEPQQLAAADPVQPGG